VRLLHTSDWHLGRHLHGASLLDAQAAVVDFVVDTARREQVDAVLIAGDLYDRAIPPLDAVELFDRALVRLAAEGVAVVAISGNHDSSARLGFASGLMEGAGVHLRSRPDACGQPVLLADEHGPVAIYPLPYLEPAVAQGPLGATECRHQAVVEAAMDRVRADLAARRGTRSVVVAHAFVAGEGAPVESDSERDVSIGGTALVGTRAFDGIDYVALGHLHRAQAPGPNVAYSGSPVAYSFSEAGHTKSVTLVELDGSGLVRTERLPTPVHRGLARVRGSLDDLLGSPAHADIEDCFVEVTLTDHERPREPMARLRERFPHVLRLAFDAPELTPTTSYRAQVEGRSDLEVCTAFVEHVRGRAATLDEIALFDRALADRRVAEVA
jgi:exonuclease SbcD